MTSHLQTPPKQPSVEEGTCQEILARNNKGQHSASLKVPDSAPRKRRSTSALSEQLLPQKHTRRTGMAFGDNDVSIIPSGDKGQIELSDTLAQFAQLRLDRAERARTKGYVEREIGLENARVCTVCGGKIQVAEKCWKCSDALCRRWLQMTEPEDEYLKILDDLGEQNQDRMTKEEKKWKKL
ncbi:hypothetical protein DL98DRAFT_521698 [Cadophora sp. DSE1049]|nr:hypothetical protein DL98DRAFT_521698 [Cadophora sp. DSE1049]